MVMGAFRNVCTLLIASVCMVQQFIVVQADLPVHCLHAETVGTWVFHLSDDSSDKQQTCGHKLPDAVMTMVDQKVEFSAPKFPVKAKYMVTLSDPDVAIDYHGNKGMPLASFPGAV